MNKECDLLIVGAGPSGLAAAIRAADSNMNTILLEKKNFLGGSLPIIASQMICGLYANSKEKPTKTLNGGLIREICDALNFKKIIKVGKVYGLNFDIDEILNTFKALIEKRENIKMIYNSPAAAVNIENNIITQVNGIKPRAVIDCSGDGAILELAGAHQPLKFPMQLSAYTFKVEGLNNCDQSINIKVPYYINQAIKNNKLPNYLKPTTFSLISSNTAYCRFNIPKNKIQADDLYKNAIEVHSYLKKVLGPFEKSYINQNRAAVANREGLRLEGEYSLTKEDVLKGNKFNNNGVKNSWPIEIWSKDGCRYQYLSPGDYYQIPDSCLKSKKINNLYAAGRCISVSQKALGSTRVIATCISLGEAAAKLATENLYENIIS